MLSTRTQRLGLVLVGLFLVAAFISTVWWSIDERRSVVRVRYSPIWVFDASAQTKADELAASTAGSVAIKYASPWCGTKENLSYGTPRDTFFVTYLSCTGVSYGVFYQGCLKDQREKALAEGYPYYPWAGNCGVRSFAEQQMVDWKWGLESSFSYLLRDLGVFKFFLLAVLASGIVMISGIERPIKGLSN